MKRTKEQLAALVWAQIDGSTDWANSALSEIRSKAWDYYLNRPRGDEMEGRSQLQDTTIRDSHSALMATIMPAYSTDTVCQFEAFGPDDQDQAEAETCAVNNIFTEDNAGYMELANAISDALLFRNGVIKVWAEDRTEKVTRRFNAEPAMVRAGITQQMGKAPDKLEVVKEGGLTLVTYEQTEQKLRVQAIEPSYFLIDPNQQNQDLQTAAFIGERVIFTRGELLDMDVPRETIKKLPQLVDEGMDGGSTSNSSESRAKFVEGASNHYQGAGWDDERVDCYWVHMRIDGDRRRFLTSQQLILLDDEVQWWPYASGAGWLVPHRWSGLGLYDLLKNSQDTKTSVQRQMLDNFNHANNAGLIYNPSETKQEDINNRAPGRGIRSNNPANNVPIPVPDITSQSLAALQHFEDVSGRQAGAALDMASSQGQTMKDVSGLSVEMQLGPKEQMASYVSRNLAETLVRHTFLLIHRTLREEWNGTLMYQKSGDWQETNPGEWQPRTRINVTIGLSPGDRRRRKSNLERVIQWQMELISGGTANITTNWKGVHNALADWLKAAELDGAEGYFLDPTGQESLQGQQAAGQESQQQAQQAQQMQQIQLQMAQQQAQIESQKLELDKYKHDADIKFKYYDANLDAELEEAKIVEQGTQARLAARASAEAGGADKGSRDSGTAKN